MRARKRRDVEIWTHAVYDWASSPYDAADDPGFYANMARAAADLRSVRRYVKSPPAARAGPPADLLPYFGGFFSGEGCFLLSGLSPRAVIRVRADDRSILELFADRFGLGAVREHPAYNSANPAVTWTVRATDGLAPAVELFEAAELRGRKRREFEVWRDAAHERAFARIGGRRWDRERVQIAADRLKALRIYAPPEDAVAQTAPRDVEREARDAYVQVLRACADEDPAGQLTCTAYQRARERHPEWPTRNTVALAFGSWAGALDAAGLASRVTQRARKRAD